MKYEPDKDKACLGDELFPYPLKLTWNSDTIYLTVLRIPTLEELAVMNKYARSRISSGDSQVDMDKLYITVDTMQISNTHSAHARKSMTTEGGRKLSVQKFVSNCGTFYNNLVVGRTYDFDIYNCLPPLMKCIANYNAGTNPDIYFTVRGNFRYGIPNSSSEYEHTGLNSNTAKIIYNP